MARAIFSSSIPIISAVGHETDFTISDFVSDLRAPTPSAAAELAVPTLSDLLSNLSGLQKRLSLKIENKIQQSWINIDQLDKRMSNQEPEKKIKNQIQNLNQIRNRYINLLKNKYDKCLKNTNYLHSQLFNLGPDQVLSRGYSIAFTKNGKIIRSPKQIKIGNHFSLKTSKGSFNAEKTSDVNNN